MDDAAAIRATIGPWAKAAIDRNWGALLEMCTSNVVFAPPGESKVTGTQLKPWLEAFPVIKVFDATFDQVDVSGDLATAVGHGLWTLTMKGQEISVLFKFVDVFRKGQDGGWRYAHVIWNLDTPMS